MLIGTTLDWVTAISSAVTALGAVGAVSVAYGVFRRDLTERQLAERSSQASLFDVWISFVDWIVNEGTYAEPDLPTGALMEVHLAAANSSGQAMRSVDVLITRGDLPLSEGWGLGVIPPTGTTGPVSRTCYVRAEEVEDLRPLEGHLIRGMLGVDASFTDAAGNRWRRTRLGELRFLYNLTQQHKDHKPRQHSSG